MFQDGRYLSPLNMGTPFINRSSNRITIFCIVNYNELVWSLFVSAESAKLFWGILKKFVVHRLVKNEAWFVPTHGHKVCIPLIHTWTPKGHFMNI